MRALQACILLTLTGCCTLGYDALVARYQAEQEACLEIPSEQAETTCIDEVRSKWRPVILTLEGP